MYEIYRNLTNINDAAFQCWASVAKKAFELRISIKNNNIDSVYHLILMNK